MIQKQSNWTIPFLFLWWRHRNYVMFLMTSSIKLWKPQVTDWNLINSEHHFRLEKTNPEPRWTAATLSRYVFAVMTSHEILSSTPRDPPDMVLIQDMEMKKLFVYFYSDWICLFLMLPMYRSQWTRYMAVKRG